MKKITFILFLGLLTTLTSYSQGNNSWNNDRICGQIQNAIVHVTNQFETKNFKIKPAEHLRYGWGYNFMNSDYVAGKLKVEKENIWEQDKEKVNGLFKLIGEIDSGLNETTFDLKLCRQQLTLKPNDPNTIISKLDDETMLFYLTKKRGGKNGPSGLIYLFFFDKDDKIEKVFKTNWIE